MEEELKREDYSYDLVAVIFAEPFGFLTNVLVQVAVSAAFNWFQFQWPENRNKPFFVTCMDKFCKHLYLVTLLPLLLRTVGSSPALLQKSPKIACFVVSLWFAGITMKKLPLVIQVFRNSVRSLRNTLKNFGVQVFIEMHWTRLHVPNVLRLFWFVRTLYIFSYIMADYKSQETNVPLEHTNISFENLHSQSTEHYQTYPLLQRESNATVISDFVNISQSLLILSCDTIFALMGMTSILSYLSHFVGIALAWYVQSNNEEDRSMGTMTAILFFILALQTGLTTMKPEKRLIRLYRNLCLLITAVLHFTHGMVNPVLMNLSASQHHHIRKHVRPLSMCLFLVAFPTIFLFVLWKNNTVGTWLLAVTAFSIEVVIKVFVSLLVYILFMIDAYRDVFWEKLDEYVYIVKACGNTIEFIFGIFLFCNGAWIMIFESGGTIRAVMMCVHAYFNIWLQAKEGWNTFIKRRTAVKKINSLPEATAEQLELNNDVCAICYQDLHSARVTRCHHYFHSVCLRKWLYLQDVCPLCHEEIYAPDTVPQGQNDKQTNNALHQD